MAVVTVYANAHPGDPARSWKAPSGLVAGMLLKMVRAEVSVTNGDSIASRFFLARVPSSAVLIDLSYVEHDALTGVTSADIGIDPRTGGAPVVNALFAAQNLTAAAKKDLLVSVTNANQGKQLWQLAGLTSDPRRDMDIYMTLNAAATATGLVKALILYGTEG